MQRRQSPSSLPSSPSSFTSWKHRQRGAGGGGGGGGDGIVSFIQPRLWWIYGLFFGFWILKTLFLHHAIASNVDHRSSSSNLLVTSVASLSSNNVQKRQQQMTSLQQFQHNHAIPSSPLLWNQNASRQVEKKDKRGNVLHRTITKLTTKDIPEGLQQLSSSTTTTTTTTTVSLSQVSQGRERLLDLLQDAGVTDMEPQVIAQLPLWKQVAQLYYYDYLYYEDGNSYENKNENHPSQQLVDFTDAGPVIVGLDTCATFRTVTPAFDRSVGVAGLFNTGTSKPPRTTNMPSPNTSKDM
jgi:hypothetical protein